MEVRNCRSCGRLFNFMGGQPVCPICREALEKKFAEVKEFINSNPRVSIAQAAEENDVSVKQIKQWIREERLVLTEPSPDGITCEHCGQPIRSGRFCSKCKSAMANSFGTVARPKSAAPESGGKQQKDGSKMRFL